MVKMADAFPEYKFVIAGAPSQDFGMYLPFLNDKNISVVQNKTYELLSKSTAALVTSGTATLETALFNVPQVVCYKGNWFSYQIAKRVIKLPFISLVNLILDRKVVTELIQNELMVKNLKQELTKILDDAHREQIFLDYHKLRKKLSGKGASKKTAALIVKNIA